MLAQKSSQIMPQLHNFHTLQLLNAHESVEPFISRVEMLFRLGSKVCGRVCEGSLYDLRSSWWTVIDWKTRLSASFEFEVNEVKPCPVCEVNARRQGGLQPKQIFDALIAYGAHDVCTHRGILRPMLIFHSQWSTHPD